MAGLKDITGMGDRFFGYCQGKGNFTKNLISTVIADVAGAIVSLAALKISRRYFAKESKKAELWIEEKVVAPHADRITGLIDSTGDFHPIDEELEKLTPKEKKVKAISKFGFEMALTAPVGLGTAWLMHKAVDNRIGLEKNSDKMRSAAYGIDAASHAVYLGLVNKTFAPALERPKQILSKLLQNLGVSKETAETSVNYLVNLELPNIAAAGTKLAAMQAMSSRAHAATR